MLKKRVFAYSFIFLVIFQLFSPWMMSISQHGVVIEKNVAEAANKSTRNETGEIDIANANAFIVVTGLDKNLDNNQFLYISTYTNPTWKINTLSTDFIVDTYGGAVIETKCTDGNINLFKNQDLSSLTPIAAKLVGFDSKDTKNNLYLKTEYKINISKATPKQLDFDCINDDSLSDAYGHYKFTYQIESSGGTKENKTEATATGQAIEKIINKEKTDGTPFVSVQNQKGENFDVSWGLLSLKSYITPMRCEGANLNGVSSDLYKLKASDTFTTAPEKITLAYLQNGKNMDFYQNSCVTSVSKTSAETKPKITGTTEHYTIGFSFPYYDSYKNYNETSFLKFNLPITGKIHSFNSLSDASNQSGIKKFSCAGDWCLKEFSVEPTILSKDEKDIFVQSKISILLSDENVKDDFKKFVDVNKNGIADSGDTPGDWEDFLADGSEVKIENKKACAGNGFYLIWGPADKDGNDPEYTACDHPDGKEVNGDGYHEININEYLFGGKTEIASPIVTKGSSGMIFDVPVGPVEFGKTYYFKLYVSDGAKKIFDLVNDGYSTTYSKTIDTNIDKIDQQIRTGVIDEGEELKNGGQDWLPSCDIADPITLVTGCLVQAFYYLFFETSAKLLELAGRVLDFVLLYSISPGVYKVGYIVDSWRFIRDLCNLFFIFMLVYLAFKIILGAGHNTKQLVVNTIIIATVINFSYPLTTLFIDVSNITARQLYYNSFNKKDETSDKPVGLSTMVASAYNPQELVLGARAENEEDDEGKGSIFFIILIGVAFNIFGIYIFLKTALQFIYRILGLVFAIILSPLAVFSYSLDSEMRGKLKMVGFDAWLSGLISDCFKAPVFLFFVLILALFVAQNPFKGIFGPDVTGIDWWMSILIPFMMIMGFMYLILKATTSMSSEIAQLAGGKIVGMIEKVGGFAIGGAATLATGGAAFLGRSTIGKLAGKSATALRNSGMGDNMLSRALLSRLDKTSKASFDVRQTMAGNALSKTTGLNMDNKLVGKIPGMSAAAAAGGYMAMKDRSKEREIKRAELWGHDKDLEEELAHRKEKLEGDLKGVESEDETNRVALKELSQRLKENTDALEKKEKEITNDFDGRIRGEDDNIKNFDTQIASIGAKLASETDPVEKINLKRQLDDAARDKGLAVTAKSNLQTQKSAAIKTLKETDPEGMAVNNTKADIKKAKDKEAELGKKKNDIKFGVEVDVVMKDGHGNVIIDPATGLPQTKKERSGGIAGTEKAIKKVQNAQMLKATLRHRTKSTGDPTKAKTFLEHYTERNGGNAAQAEAELKAEFGADNYKKISQTNYKGIVTDKKGHEHEVSHMINEHFKPGDYKNNYKSPAGGGNESAPKHDKPSAHKEEHH